MAAAIIAVGAIGLRAAPAHAARSSCDDPLLDVCEYTDPWTQQVYECCVPHGYCCSIDNQGQCRDLVC
jgi:hypothetical protein